MSEISLASSMLSISIAETQVKDMNATKKNQYNKGFNIAVWPCDTHTKEFV